MKFFNRKEDVIDVQLTQYGKHLFSKGKLKPAYYEFFDDDVLYDINYSDVTEEQNSSETRIKETPRVRTQYVFSDREIEHKRIVKEIRSKNQNTTNIVPPILQDKTYFLSAPLGNSNFKNKYSPAWNVNVAQGEISGTVNFMSSSLVSFMKIPQVNLKNISFVSSIISTIPSTNEEGASVSRGNLQGNVSKLEYTSAEFEDGTYISSQGSGILFSVEEENINFEKENFEIEIYKVKDVTGSKQELTPLSFVKKPQKIIDGILLDEEDIEKYSSNEIDETYVEYYFDICVDDEIREKDILTRKKNNLYENKVVKSDSPFGDSCGEK